MTLKATRQGWGGVEEKERGGMEVDRSVDLVCTINYAQQGFKSRTMTRRKERTRGL